MFSYQVEENGFNPENIERNGSKYLVANGYMGYRGTLEEFSAEQLVALNLAGLFDRHGDLWRESVNAPNPFYTVCRVGESVLNPLCTAVSAHRQALDVFGGIHHRETDFCVNGVTVRISAERFVSMQDEHLAAMKYTVSADADVTVSLETKVDTAVWDINGPHCAVLSADSEGDVNTVRLETLESKTPLVVYEHLVGAENQNEICLSKDKPFTFVKLCGVYWGKACADSLLEFQKIIRKDYDTLKEEHIAVWKTVWENADVEIEGDEAAQQALRYSIYHLCSIAPRHSVACGIPARGLSGQVYKGASFWDTEMFMLPFFSFTEAHLAENLVKYRVNTLAGAKRKAAEYGCEGAFYAWESQETGDDACSDFNVTDVFTGRPQRTYFKDKQIHISADVVYGIWEYSNITGNNELLMNGGLETIYECVLFLYSYAVFKPLRNRFELADTIGPDEYHERVSNNFYTNKMVQKSVDVLLLALERVAKQDPDFAAKFSAEHDVSWVREFREKLYVPQPDDNGVIEQFDGYYKLEDISLDELKRRIIKPNEYLGGHGIAATTKIIKQADVVMTLNVFRHEYDEKVKKANWDYYEPYTEHGSSLSACAYAIVAASIGYTDWAYKYFMKTATVDLTGDTKQYAGTIYIGGTHPAANGGSWNTAIFGLAGVSYSEDVLDISPRLPASWTKMSFKLLWKGVRLQITVSGNKVQIIPIGSVENINVTVYGKKYEF